MNGIVFIDLIKAFDLVDHDIILKKFEMYHSSEHTIKLFKSHLADQSQHISFGGCLLDKPTVTASVSQGSILGPLLFSLFINDMPLHTKGDVAMYADDSTLSEVGKSVNELEDPLYPDLEQIDSWFDNNCMIVNTSKTNVMLMIT